MTSPSLEIDAALVERLLAEQFPPWADRLVTPVLPGGWDNRTFRLGDDLAVRLPSAAGYVAAVEKEHRWLPHLAPHLPLPIPSSLALGAPGAGYPWRWSVRRWIDGRPATLGSPAFARDLAGFLRALWKIDAAGGPAAGEHSFHRGGRLGVYDEETRAALAALDGRADVAAAARVWDGALASTWTGAPVWFHGDVAVGNLLVDGAGRLSAVIDFGTCGIGDPACDLVIAWTLLEGHSRAVFQDEIPLDDATWARARGWALWKALINLAAPDARPPDVAGAARTLDAVLGEGQPA